MRVSAEALSLAYSLFAGQRRDGDRWDRNVVERRGFGRGDRRRLEHACEIDSSLAHSENQLTEGLRFIGRDQNLRLPPSPFGLRRGKRFEAGPSVARVTGVNGIHRPHWADDPDRESCGQERGGWRGRPAD